MGIKDTILGTIPTSYWPLDDLAGSSCHDELGLHDASAPAQGVSLAVIPFGSAQAPYFDGALGSFLTIESDPQYGFVRSRSTTPKPLERQINTSISSRRRSGHQPT
jgi:hypothetical protein